MAPGIASVLPPRLTQWHQRLSDSPKNTHTHRGVVLAVSGWRRYASSGRPGPSGRARRVRGWLQWPCVRTEKSMEVAQLDGISAVLGALAASAGAGVGDAVKDMAKST